MLFYFFTCSWEKLRLWWLNDETNSSTLPFKSNGLRSKEVHGLWQNYFKKQNDCATRFENGSKLANITPSMTTPALKDCCDFYFRQFLFSFKTSKIWGGAQERYELISDRWNSISLWLMRLNYFCPILQKKNRCGILNINVLKCLPNNTPQEDKKKIK